jgi:hypothetical protein
LLASDLVIVELSRMRRNGFDENILYNYNEFEVSLKMSECSLEYDLRIWGHSPKSLTVEKVVPNRVRAECYFEGRLKVARAGYIKVGTISKNGRGEELILLSPTATHFMKTTNSD